MTRSTFPRKKDLVLLFAAFFLYILSAGAANPEMTNTLKNLSQGLLGQEYEDFNPELAIEGQTVHALWTTRAGNSEGYLFYCRSTDLGKTWEQPKQIYQYKDGSSATDVSSQRLAVSGNNVYIGFSDYDYSNNGTGYIYLAKSTDNGANFGPTSEIDNSGGGYSRLSYSFIRAEGNNVVIAYRDANYNNAFEGLYCQFSGNNGNSFTRTKISEENTSGISDLLYQDGQIIVVHEYAYYYYGLNTGRVYVSVSDDSGASFKTNKVSITYIDSNLSEHERCRSYHDSRYVPKVSKDGANIHLIFNGYNENGIWTLLYARSPDNGATFQKAVDINNGKIGDSNIQGGQESLAAKGGHVYLEYLSTGSKVYLVRSDDNGATLSEPQDLMTENTSYIKTTWWPQLVTDPTDESGKTVFFGFGPMGTRKSTDGGKTFTQTQFLAPILQSGSDVKGSALKIDASGNVHWLGKARWYWTYDYDIFYGNKTPQSGPGSENKALSVESVHNGKLETVIVPSSPTLAFDSAMTGEAWVKLHKWETWDWETGKVSVFAKINGYDGDDYSPSGFNIGFRFDNGNYCINSGLKTDKGDFINWGNSNNNINDTLWHHIAITYDANAGLNNFKTYLDGILITEQTVTGSIYPGEGLFMIGARSSFVFNMKYKVDDIRLWDHALNQEELQANQTKKFTGNEEGLKLWLNFNDTYKDLSGNGNDAIPLNSGTLSKSDFDPPLSDFDMYQAGNEISFNNKTKNATSSAWDFGDGSTSALGNPKYTYPKPGEYSIILASKNENSVTSTLKNATIEGLDRVEPAEGGNLGYVTINVFGGGLATENTTLILRKEGETDITGEEISSPGKGALSAFFNLYGSTTGDWDVVVKHNGAEMVLPRAFRVIQGIEPDPWVNISGRGLILFNTWQTYTINFGNNGNVDAYSVPLWLAFTNYPELEIEFVDFNVVVPEIATQLGISDDIKALDIFFETDAVLGQPMNARVYPLVIPVIPANSSYSAHIRIKTPGSVQVKAWMNPPWVEYAAEGSGEKSALLTQGQLKLKVAECVTGVLAEGIVDIGTSAIPGVGCAWSIGKQVYQTYQTPPWDKKFSFWGTLWNSAVTFVDCGVNLSGVGGIVKGVGVFMANMGGYIKSINECNQIGKDISAQDRNIGAVSSFDPNEMVGPSGFGSQNYIAKNNTIPYTILFENKSSATAPAHAVTVTDTLDLSKFDLAGFGFGSFGWGDSIYTPVGSHLKEFSEDIDMRPRMNLVARVSGKLDTITGVVKWEFLSLNPATMDIEEDPMAGFLPPNVSSPEGEGFVSFSAGLKPGLENNSEIRNKAKIVFDANKPIFTNEYLNTLDLDTPESQVYPLDANIKSNFEVAWSGSDKSSGVRDYTIYVLENDTALRPWIVKTTDLSSTYHGQVGSSYKFYSIAADNVSHTEAEPGEYDASTLVTVDAEEFKLSEEKLRVYPNPAEGQLTVAMLQAPAGVYVIELIGADGSSKFSEIYRYSELSEGVKINLKGYTPGAYILKVIYGDKAVNQKIMVR